jgi:hypothetical protein
LTEIPAAALQLRSLVRADQTVELFLEAVDVPEPGPGEVIVRVEAAPINPSDLGRLLAGADVTAAVSGGTADHHGVRVLLKLSARAGTRSPRRTQNRRSSGRYSRPMTQRVLEPTGRRCQVNATQREAALQPVRLASALGQVNKQPM